MPVNAQKTMRVTVDLDVCQGHGVCHMSEPRVYDLDPEDGHSIPLAGDIPAELQAGAQLGVDSCPERALTAVYSEAPAGAAATPSATGES